MSLRFQQLFSAPSSLKADWKLLGKTCNDFRFNKQNNDVNVTGGVLTGNLRALSTKLLAAKEKENEANWMKTCHDLEQLGTISNEEQKNLFQILVGILYLGQVYQRIYTRFMNTDSVVLYILYCIRSCYVMSCSIICYIMPK